MAFSLLLWLREAMFFFRASLFRYLVYLISYLLHWHQCIYGLNSINRFNYFLASHSDAKTFLLFLFSIFSIRLQCKVHIRCGTKPNQMKQNEIVIAIGNATN